jgi:hypothetical protein
LTFRCFKSIIISKARFHKDQGRMEMPTDIRVSRRRLLSTGARGAFLTAAVGIAPKFLRPGRAYAADALAPA